MLHRTVVCAVFVQESFTQQGEMMNTHIASWCWILCICICIL